MTNGEKVFKKLSEGSPNKFWQTITNLLSVVPGRSTGITLQKSYRQPAPGSRPEKYAEAVTMPTGDIAENPFWKRDMRRNYPKTNVITQPHLAGLLTYGSRENPSPYVYLILIRIANVIRMLQSSDSKDLANVDSLSLVDVLGSKEIESKTRILDNKGMAPIPGKPYNWKHEPKAAFEDGERHNIILY